MNDYNDTAENFQFTDISIMFISHFVEYLLSFQLDSHKTLCHFICISNFLNFHVFPFHHLNGEIHLFAHFLNLI